MKHRSSKQAIACDIPQSVRDAVHERDHRRCVVCGSIYGAPNAHVVSRAHGGKGIEQNIVTLCANCHFKFDNGRGDEQESMRVVIEDYMKRKYPNWNTRDITYKGERL